jgi:hypothetical protein
MVLPLKKARSAADGLATGLAGAAAELTGGLTAVDPVVLPAGLAATEPEPAVLADAELAAGLAALLAVELAAELPPDDEHADTTTSAIPPETTAADL